MQTFQSREHSKTFTDDKVVPIRDLESLVQDSHATLHIHIQDEDAARRRQDIAMLWILNGLLLGLLFVIGLK